MIVYGWPKDMKAFYMRVNDDNQVMIMDLKKKIKKNMKAFYFARQR